MSAPTTPAEREARIAEIEAELAALRARAAEIERRWAGIQSDYGRLRAVRSSGEVAANG